MKHFNGCMDVVPSLSFVFWLQHCKQQPSGGVKKGAIPVHVFSQVFAPPFQGSVPQREAPK
eukprot:1161930-Pelagomonas_calceolata.AAC.2